MSTHVRPEQLWATSDKAPVEVLEALGEGGQGAVFTARVRGTQRALKWYAQGTSREMRQRLEVLTQQGAPSKCFLWPEEIVQGRCGGAGYLMPLAPPGYQPLTRLMTGDMDPDFRALARAGRQLCEAMLSLHARGLCYGDINFGNVFMEPTRGQILICDNDNVVVDGDRTSVLGTMRFMAPEIVRGEGSPCADTDRWSLAVLLFHALMLHHPLEGLLEQRIRCLDQPAMERLYGHNVRFIFDPEDASNRPDPQTQSTVLRYWSLYPAFIQRLFIRAFTDGARDARNGRVRESEWIEALGRLEDLVFTCSCGADSLHDLELMRTQPEALRRCWSCDTALTLPPRMRLRGGRMVLLDDGAELRGAHLLSRPGPRQDEVMGHVIRAPDGALGLKNSTREAWSAQLEGRAPVEIPPGRTLILRRGGKLYFQEMDADLRVPPAFQS